MIHDLDIIQSIISFIIDVYSQEEDGKNHEPQASFILASYNLFSVHDFSCYYIMSRKQNENRTWQSEASVSSYI